MLILTNNCTKLYKTYKLSVNTSPPFITDYPVHPSKKLNNLIYFALFRYFLVFWSNCQEGRSLDGGGGGGGVGGVN